MGILQFIVEALLFSNAHPLLFVLICRFEIIARVFWLSSVRTAQMKAALQRQVIVVCYVDISICFVRCSTVELNCSVLERSEVV